MPFKAVCLSTIMFIMVLSFCMPAQKNFLSHTIQFTPKDRPLRSLDQKSYKNLLLDKYTPLISDKTYLHEFVSDLVSYKISYLNSNLEYEDLSEMNAYLGKIVNLLGFDKVLNTPVEIKLVRDPSFNAYVYEDGIIYIHIGLLANVDNEAEIAAVLSHELGHIVNQHTYKRFLYEKQFLEKQGRINRWTSNFSHLIASSVNRKQYSDNLITQEEEADAFAFDMVQRSSFDFSAFNSLFHKFSLAEDKYKNSLSYKKSWFYIKTHPTSDNRGLAAIKAATGAVAKSKFPVDSSLFARIKQQAIDETIHLLFEELDFNACLETAFRQHLFFPEDEFYLFYITESTRRLMAADADCAKKLFISGLYDPGFYKSNAGIAPTVIYTEGKLKHSDSRVKLSIFNKLSGIILPEAFNITSIPNKTLVQKDTVRFLTYEDALHYFTGLNKKLNFALNNYPVAASALPSAGLDSIFSSRADKNQYYRYLPALVKDYKTQPPEGKTLWIISDFHYFGEEISLFSSSISLRENDTYTRLLSYFDSTGLTSQFAKRQELDFDEYNKIAHYFSFASQRLVSYKNGSMKIREKVPYTFSDVMPELYALLRAHHYKSVIFSSINITSQEKDMMGAKSSMVFWTVNNYLFDPVSNTIGCYAGNIMNQQIMSPMLNFGGSAAKRMEQKYVDGLLKTLAATAD